MSGARKKELSLVVNDPILDQIRELAAESARSAAQEAWDSSFQEAIRQEITRLKKELQKETLKLEKIDPPPKKEVEVLDFHSTSEQKTEKKKLSPENKEAVEKIDSLLLHILDGFIAYIVQQARQSTEYILNVSNNFLDENSRNALEDFNNLYFSKSAEIQSTTESVNSEVDQLVDKLRAGATEEELNTIDLEENEDAKMARLRISGIQKKLETIITMDNGIREKLMPILHSMQFEDVVSQRLEHIRTMWGKVLIQIREHSCLESEDFHAEIKNVPTSVKETEDFYKIVYKEEPPEGKRDSASIINVLF